MRIEETPEYISKINELVGKYFIDKFIPNKLSWIGTITADRQPQHYMYYLLLGMSSALPHLYKDCIDIGLRYEIMLNRSDKFDYSLVDHSKISKILNMLIDYYIDDMKVSIDISSIKATVYHSLKTTLDVNNIFEQETF